MSGLTFGYWNTRGRGQPLRFLLEYTKAAYTEKTYQFDINEAEWYNQDKLKFKPFPNLPYIIEDGFYLSEHDSVIKYIVKRDPKYHELLGIGKGKNDEVIVDQLISVINVQRAILRNLCFSKDIDQIKTKTLVPSIKQFQELQEFRGGNTFLLPYLSTADFKLTEVLLYFKAIEPELYNMHLSSFDSLISAFYKLPGIAQYIRSERYLKITHFFAASKATFTGEEFIKVFNQQFKQ